MNAAIDSDAVRLRGGTLQVEVRPDLGLVLTSIRDLGSNLEALWRRDGFVPAAAGRTLGPGGAASIESLSDLFVGGWFQMFPSVGFPGYLPGPAGLAETLLHGEACRLPWQVIELSGDRIVAELDLIRWPLHLTRTLLVDARGRLTVATAVENRASVPVPYAWGEHPCFRRSSFAGGRLELDAEWSRVPGDGSDTANGLLARGRTFDYPTAPGVHGGEVDVAAIPALADGRHDQILVRLQSGVVRLRPPGGSPTFRLEFDIQMFPYALVWQDYRAPGASWWGSADTIAVEPISIPARSMAEAIELGAVQELGPGQSISTTLVAGWETN